MYLQNIVLRNACGERDFLDDRAYIAEIFVGKVSKCFRMV